MVVAKKYVYAKPFDGIPTNENLKIVEEELPALKDGEYLAETVYLGINSYIKDYLQFIKIGDHIPGSQVSKIIESKSKKFTVGKYVISNFGVRSHTVAHETEKHARNWGHPMIISFADELPASLALSVLGMPGVTAYFGLLEVCKAKSGETVIISGATGVIGNIVGQIAKIIGCTVIGITGSDDKIEWLKSLGFDHVVNYKTQDVRKTLKEIAPQRIDCYFDSIGGEISSIVLENMNRFGRIAICGAMTYSQNEQSKASIVQRSMLAQQLVMRGFLMMEFTDRWDEAVSQNLKWVQEGKLKYKETIIDGFDNTLHALQGTLQGDYYGKVIIKI